jgi:hypothetical protein
VFDAGFDQARRGEPAPAALIDKGLGSVYAQLWAKIVGGRVAPTSDGEIAAALRAPPAPKPLQVAAVGAGSGSAAPDEPAAQEPEPEPAAASETEDWETDVVLAPPDAGVASDATPAGGQR